MQVDTLYACPIRTGFTALYIDTGISLTLYFVWNKQHSKVRLVYDIDRSTAQFRQILYKELFFQFYLEYSSDDEVGCAENMKE